MCQEEEEEVVREQEGKSFYSISDDKNRFSSLYSIHYNIQSFDTL